MPSFKLRKPHRPMAHNRSPMAHGPWPKPDLPIFDQPPARLHDKTNQLPPIRDLPSFIKAHEFAYAQVANYLSAAKPRQRLSRDVIRELHPSQERFLYANNFQSRIAFAKIVVAHAEAIIRLAGEGDLFWVHLNPRQYAVRVSDAAAFNTRALQAWVRQVLPGHHFIGMVEAALYTNWGLVSDQPDRTVSWHAHLIVWGTSAARLRQDLQRINNRYQSLVPGIASAYLNPVTPE